MRNVLTLLKPYKISIIIAYLLTFIELIIELFMPFFLGKMINSGVVHKDLDVIIMWGSIMIGLALISFLMGITNSFYASHTALGFAYDIRKKLFAKVQSFSLKNLTQFPTSGLVTRFTNDVRQLQNTIFMSLRIMIRAPLFVMGGIVMAFIVNYKIAAIFLITVPFLISFLLWVLKRATKLFNRLQGKVDEVNRVMQENLAGMRLIKAFVKKDDEEKRFEQANKDLAHITRHAFRFVETSMPVLLFIMNMSLIVILWFGNIQILAGSTDVGDVVAIVNYALRIAMAISMFTFIILFFSRAKASAERLDDVLSTKVDLMSYENANQSLKVTHGNIQFKNVSFKYPNKKEPVLKNMSFTVNPGEKIAIIGATGAGKSSLFQLIPRLYDTSKGEIFIDGQSITSYTLENLRKAIGYVPQNPLLFSGKIADNIAWGKENATQDEIITAAIDAQIHETIMALPNQYDTKVGQKGVNLSGGQKQRISIARALVRRPKILMFDDSTSALDLTTEARLLQAIQSYDSTLIIITQKISTAMKANRIILIDQGEILAQGTHTELLQQSKLYLEIYKSQFKEEFFYAN